MTTTTSRRQAPQHANRLRGPFNSWILHALDGYFERRLGDIRAELYRTLEGEIVEIGAGNGPTFRHLPPGVRVHAVEPNEAFHRRLRRNADEHGLDLVIHPTSAETIDLPDNSIDAVVSSWVLCTVADPRPVLREVRRVLRPGGRFVFHEHVAAPTGSAVRRVQEAVHRPWKWVFEGCHTNRDTARLIREAGFAEVDDRLITVPTALVPIRPQVVGTARA